MKHIHILILFFLTELFCSCGTSQRDFTPQSHKLNEKVDIPLVASNSLQNLLLVRASVNNKKGLFVVDTGANICALSQRFAKESGLTLNALSSQRLDTNVKSEIMLADVDMLKLGSSEFNDLKVAVLSLEHINQFTDTPIDGIIGMSLLKKNHTLTIDYKKSLLVLNSKRCQGHAAPLIMKDDALFTDMLVNGKATRMQIDTGSSVTMVDEKTWQLLKGNGTIREEVATTADINGANLKSTQQFIAIDMLTLGDVCIRDVSIRSGDNNLLGMDLIKRYAVTFAFDENKMYFDCK